MCCSYSLRGDSSELPDVEVSCRFDAPLSAASTHAKLHYKGIVAPITIPPVAIVINMHPGTASSLASTTTTKTMTTGDDNGGKSGYPYRAVGFTERALASRSIIGFRKGLACANIPNSDRRSDAVST